MPRTSTKRAEEGEAQTANNKGLCFLCCGASSIADVIESTQMAAASLRATPPLELLPGCE